MGHPYCRSCKGDGYFWSRDGRRKSQCNKCNGSGLNRDLWEQRCQNCYTTFVVKYGGGSYPDYCPACRNKEFTKTCAQDGCGNTIRYKLSWTNVSNYCKHCEGKRRNGFTASRCKGVSGYCGKIVWSPPGKHFETCADCSQRKREQEAAKWREKSCPGLKGTGYCGKTIKYRVDWDKVPDICPDCREKAKRAKAECEAKMREKPCAGGCGKMIRYSTDWEHPPSFCKECKEKRKSQTRPERQATGRDLSRTVDTTDLSYVMPGVRETIGQLGGVRGKHYPYQGKVHCIVFEGMSGNDIHYSWNVDPSSGEVIGTIYGHPNDQRGRRL